MNKHQITELPAVTTRVETGPVRFGDDWPGVFIRGDDAFHFAHCLNQVIAKGSRDKSDAEEFFFFSYARNLQELLESCVLEPSSGEEHVD